ncbi:hypothetical protein SKAU_G00177730 [Synaphobranchus kaupii]|uniref:RING1 and YY1-binding protein n=1 Tax=Synaphobranchus kaupii TaxID=118154 RepID=A0A9Q1J104_SYNKA|nr:hypothetical protein SKAU_G00177730 [Synaphobranchus kaupii]
MRQWNGEGLGTRRVEPGRQTGRLLAGGRRSACGTGKGPRRPLQASSAFSADGLLIVTSSRRYDMIPYYEPIDCLVIGWSSCGRRIRICAICEPSVKRRQRAGRETRVPSERSRHVAKDPSARPKDANKLEKKEKTDRPERERADGERPDPVRPEGEGEGEAEQLEKDRPEKEKPDREKEISHPVAKKPNSKKTKPKSDIHQSPPNSIQSANSTTKTNNSHISRPKLKNIDRSTAQQLAITVGNVTVIITDFKEKTRTSSTSSSTVTSSTGSEQQHQSSGSESMDKGSSRASTPKGDLSLGHDESF